MYEGTYSNYLYYRSHKHDIIRGQGLRDLQQNLLSEGIPEQDGEGENNEVEDLPDPLFTKERFATMQLPYIFYWVLRIASILLAY